MFSSFTLANGQPLDIPSGSIQFLEELTATEREKHPGARCGFFYDFGEGPEAALVQEPYNKIAKVLRTSHKDMLMELTTADGGKTALLRFNVVALRGLDDSHPNDGKCQITHRLAQKILRLDVKESRDDIYAQVAPTPAPVGEE